MPDALALMSPEAARAISNIVQALAAVARDEQGKGAVKAAGTISV
jgi:hypothetical protein